MNEILLTSENDSLFEGKSIEELNALLDGITPDGALATETPVEAPPEAPAEPVPDAPSEPEAPAEPEPDVTALEAEIERNRREKLEADLKLQQAHSSRMAGEIGYLRKQLESMPRTSEPYEPQSQGELDRLTQLEQTVARAESERQHALSSQAFADAVGRLDGDWSVKYKDEIAQVVPKYADLLEQAKAINDPVIARQMAEGLVLTIKAEAMQIDIDKRHKFAVERKASSVAASVLAKKAASVSASGAVPAAPPKPKSYADMTPDEADAWLRANVR